MENTQDSELVSKINDIRQSPEWAKHMQSMGWSLHLLNDGQLHGYSRKIPLTPFSVLKVQRSKQSWDWDSWDKIRHDSRVIYSVFEPWTKMDDNKFRQHRFRQTKDCFIAPATRVIELTNSTDKLWHNMSENSRRLVNRNEKMTLSEVNADEFRNEWQKWAKTWILPKEQWQNLNSAFGNNIRLVVGQIDGRITSGLALIKYKNTLNYFQTFTTEYGRQTGAHCALVWSEILRAKELGIEILDLEGVNHPERINKAWDGFSEFKKRIGGKLIYLPLPWERWL